MKDMFRWRMMTIWRRCPSIYPLSFVDLKLNIWTILDYAFAVIWMKIGLESGVIMSLCRLQQIWYVLLSLFVIMYLFSNVYSDLTPVIACMK